MSLIKLNHIDVIQKSKSFVNEKSGTKIYKHKFYHNIVPYSDGKSNKKYLLAYIPT